VAGCRPDGVGRERDRERWHPASGPAVAVGIDLGTRIGNAFPTVGSTVTTPLKVRVYPLTGQERLGFASHNVSSAQRLPNDNTFIDEGADGRIFDYTPVKEIVWAILPTDARRWSSRWSSRQRGHSFSVSKYTANDASQCSPS
jgi:hypothetical protein